MGCTGELRRTAGEDGLGSDGPRGDGPNSGGDNTNGSGALADADPNRVTLHRLNRVEYNRTVSDLFRGLEISPADDFPADDESHGFNNIASTLTIDSQLFELYARAADDVLDAALVASHRDKWLPCAGVDDTCTRQVIASTAARAWRRPAEQGEVERLLGLVNAAQADGLSWDESVKQGLKAVLISPHFLFRVEIDPDPTSVVPHPLTGHELASRLSYFLWSSMPDDELFELAASGELLHPDTLQAQVDRMLKDPKSRSLAENFATQWLRVNDINEGITKDLDVYPDFDPDLLKSMRKEIDLLLARFIQEGRTLSDLFYAQETFVDERLAGFYGVALPLGEGFELASLANVPRRGLLTTAGMQTLLSYPERTSPVVRGVWMLEHLLCIEPPPPPSNFEIPSIVPSPNATTREELAEHRANPACATCHNLMDPIGLAFENYDAIGAFREQDDGKTIDASGELPDGQPFADALEMLRLLSEDQQVQKCVTEKALTYALGRALESSDESYIEEISSSMAPGELTFAALAKKITASDAFMMRRGEGVLR